MCDLSKNASDNLLILLEGMEDPRKKKGVRYKYADLLLMCIYAVLCGHSTAVDIAAYTEDYLEYFKELLHIEQRPSHDTFSRIMRLTDFDKLSEILGRWLQENFPEICTRYNGYRLLHLDGKAIRGAAKKSDGEKPRYVMNMMYEGESISVKIGEVGDKENEISILKEYLEPLDLKNTIVTADAMSTNDTILSYLTQKGADYVVPLKDNQPRLKAVVEDEIEKLEKSGEFKELDHSMTFSKEHGRIETVHARVLKDTSFIYENLGLESFYGTVARIGIIDKKSVKTEKGKEVTSENRMLLITSLEWVSAEQIHMIRKAHWNIEMNHWQLDIQLDEDRCTARRENAMSTGAVLRRFCLAVKARDMEMKDKTMKRFLQANERSTDRLERLLFGTVASEA